MDGKTSRPHARSQGAMEYLMTYGWAILVVMVIGVAMWQLGIFNMGESVPPTAVGFQAQKPLLATCEMSGTSLLGLHGFTCQFTNNAGTAINIKKIEFRVNNELCELMIVDLEPPYSPQLYYLVHPCGPADDCDAYPTNCADSSWGPCPWGDYLPVPKDATYTVAYASSSTYPAQRSDEQCYNIKKGEPYNVLIDIGYDITIGQVTSTKHETGTIHMIGT